MRGERRNQQERGRGENDGAAAREHKIIDILNDNPKRIPQRMWRACIKNAGGCPTGVFRVRRRDEDCRLHVPKDGDEEGSHPSRHIRRVAEPEGATRVGRRTSRASCG